MADFSFLGKLQKGAEMFLTNVNSNAPPKKKQEGDLFKIIEAHGKRFEIRYGYYEDVDRQNPYLDPIEIYPDFLKNPLYTENGVPFVTAIQKPCEYFRGELDEENTCYQCAYYERCEELLGVCKCKENKK